MKTERKAGAWLLDFFIPGSNRLYDETHYQYRAFVGVSLALLVFLLALNVIAPQLMTVTSYGARLSNILTLFMAFSIVSCLFVFRQTARQLIAANILLVSFWFTFFSSSFVLGGARAPTLPFFLLLPVLAAIIAGAWPGVIWAALSALSLLLLLLLEQSGYQFSQLIVAPNDSIVFIVSLLVTGIAITGAFVVYVGVNHRIRRSLSIENELLDYLSHHDPLTKLANRKNFSQQLEYAIERAERYKLRFCLMVLDLNGFKEINDRFGHHAGDLLLMNVASRLILGVRQSDFTARLGDDEFAIIVDNIDDPDHIQSIADKLTIELEEPILLRQATVNVKVSIGASIYPDHGTDVQTLQEKADRAMYDAKSTDVNRVVFGLSANGQHENEDAVD